MTTEAGAGRGNKVEFFPEGMSGVGSNAGTFYTHGHYDFAVADSNLTQASATQLFGTPNEPSATHASIIAGGPGAASGGAGAVEIEVTGSSIDEQGVRTPGDSEVIVSDITTMALNQYFETTKKWLGQVTYTLKNASGSTQTTFNADFNYGHCKYSDLSDSNFIIKAFKMNGLANANDTGFNVRVLKHSAIGWTYSAAAFVPGNGQILSLADEYGTDKDLSSGENFSQDRVGLNSEINGAGSEGFIVEITTGSNNSIQYLNSSVGVIFK